MLARFLRDESGVTAIEYGMIAGGISVVIVLVVNLIGESVNDLFFGPVLSAFKAE